ncbi:MAG: SufD family Fe-S cluster assembly protein [Actinomycetota bacterium]|nr:SufD family Fe-S cluster assembly protein [Actinomycetota bacterium]
MPASLTDAVAADAPDRDLRLAAAERAAGMAVPSAELEVWRYSRIAELDLGAFAPAAVHTTVTGAQQVPAADPALVAEMVAGLDVHDVFDELSAAHHTTVAIAVPAGKVLAEPIVVTHHLDGDGAAFYPRLIVHGGADSEFTVVERFESTDGSTVLVVPRLVVHAAQAARVSYVGVNLLGAGTWQLGHQQATGERDSTTLLATVALGGDYARVRTDARLVGHGATTKQVALYYADGTQMHDFRTLQDHVAPKTYSDLLFKGAVQNTAKSVYTGLIRIREEAKGSVAYQTNRNLTLSEGAWAESVPNLDIRNNDVKCSHASTVGPIDDEQRFYLESRGIPPEVAERLVVLGFFDDVLNLLPASLQASPLRGELRARVAAKLERER